MSRQDVGIRRLATLVTGAGIAGVATGAAAWMTVRSQIAEEKIVVPAGARWCAGRTVKGPLSAYEEAGVIKRGALRATGGRTYGELDDGDPVADLAREASQLRASLFTSILAFGLAAAQVAFGGALVMVGVALSRTANRAP
jgi:hypothetical protein